MCIIRKIQFNADGIILIILLHKSWPGDETEVAVFPMEAVLSTFRISKQGLKLLMMALCITPTDLWHNCYVNNLYCNSQRTLSPFCNVLQGVGPPVRTCSVDRDLFAECNLIESLVPPVFQVLLLQNNV